MLRDDGEHGKTKNVHEQCEKYIVSKIQNPIRYSAAFLVVGGARCNKLAVTLEKIS